MTCIEELNNVGLFDIAVKETCEEPETVPAGSKEITCCEEDTNVGLFVKLVKFKLPVNDCAEIPPLTNTDPVNWCVSSHYHQI